MPKFNYLNIMNREEFNLPISKDIHEFFNNKREMEHVPYTFIENLAECCCYIRCHWSDIKEEVCQHIHLANNRYRIKFRYVILFQGFRIRCLPGFSLNVPDSSSSEFKHKIYVKLKAVPYDCGFVVQLQTISTIREKQISMTELNDVFAIKAVPGIKNSVYSPCCGVLCCWGKDTDIDIDGFVTLNSKLRGESMEINSHPSLVTEWNNEDLYPNNLLYVFLKKIQSETYEKIQIWNLQYFAPGQCKKNGECNCLLCKQYLHPTNMFCKGLLTKNTNKEDIFFIRNGLSLTCKSENVIYLITCKECGYQYVGVSKIKMLKKFHDHLNLLANDKDRSISRKLLYQHFRRHSSPDDLLQNLSVEIIDHVSNEHDISINKIRQYWIDKLDTFHHGLNGKPTDYEHHNFIQKTKDLTDENNNSIIVRRFLEGLEA